VSLDGGKAGFGRACPKIEQRLFFLCCQRFAQAVPAQLPGLSTFSVGKIEARFTELAIQRWRHNQLHAQRRARSQESSLQSLRAGICRTRGRHRGAASAFLFRERRRKAQDDAYFMARELLPQHCSYFQPVSSSAIARASAEASSILPPALIRAISLSNTA
jgi:hypothetical protein